MLGGNSTASPLWREVQRSYGVLDVASVVFRDRFGCWGFLDLWSKRAYAAEDVELLRDVAPGVTEALRLRQARTFTVVAAAPSQSVAGPVVLLLRDDLSVVGQTGASQEWLGILLPQPGVYRPSRLRLQRRGPTATRGRTAWTDTSRCHESTSPTASG